MRVLWYVKDSPTTSSAYGRIGRELLPRINPHHPSRALAPVGVKYGKLNYGGVIFYPGLEGDPKSEKLIEPAYRDFKADALIVINDVWPYGEFTRLAERIPIVWYPFVDYFPIPGWILDKLKPSLAIIPPTRWLEEELEKGLEESEVNVLHPCPLGIDSKMFKPLAKSKSEVIKSFPKTRESLGGDCDFLIGIVAMNQLWRKNLEEQIRIVSRFIDDNPDVRTGLYLHSYPNIRNAYDLMTLVKEYNLAEQTIFPDPPAWHFGFEDEEIVRIYNACDLVLELSPEGWGYPILESLAVGTPCISLDWLGMAELNPFEELRVKPSRYFHTPNPVLRKALPDEDNALKAMEHVLNSDPEHYFDNGVEFTARFDWSNVLPNWFEHLEEIEERVKEVCMSPPKPSQDLMERMEPCE